MERLLFTQLDYHQNSAELFDHFAHLPYSMLLDSCYPANHQQRYDIMVAMPETIIIAEGNKTRIQQGSGDYYTQDDVFTVIKNHINDLKKMHENPCFSVPFTIGALGYFSYDIGSSLETLPQSTIKDINLPDAVIGIYDWSIVTDHLKQETWLITRFNRENPKFLSIQKLLKESSSKIKNFSITRPFQANMTKTEYTNAFLKLKKHIYQGDCYQVNLCQRFTAEYQGSEWQAYQYLRQKNPVPFAGFMHLPQGKILSLSPERFLQVKNRYIETKPIKGTSARFNDPEKDKQSAEMLRHSKKDQAENVMIVDLLRNDLGKTCKPGSIKVPKLFDLESFPNVHHLVSTIIGELNESCDPIDVLRHAFPGGSITGAPKISAMTIIDALEKHRRSVYCGSIAYIDIHNHMDSNIAIRTLICNQQKIHCYGGGGIVFDSDSDSEYKESWIKVEKLIQTLEELSNKNQLVNESAL